MPGEGEIVKLRIIYAKGSQTFNRCNPESKNKDLLEAAEAIVSLREKEEADKAQFIKITETDLIEYE